MTVLALLETASNQRYLFETNKLAEVVGASHLVAEATTTWVTEAIEALNLASGRVENGEVEVLLSSSGKAIVAVPEDHMASDLVFHVTCRALVEAPGLRLHGVVSEPFEWSQDGSLHRAIGQAHRALEAHRPSIIGPELRFLRLPPVAECRSSGLPAAHHSKIRGDGDARSHQILAKLDATEDGLRRLTSAVDADHAAHLGELEAELLGDRNRWIAVVHADANGLGQLFLDFEATLKAAGVVDAAKNRTYADRFKNFSLAIAAATESALRLAVEESWPNETNVLPLVPLVIGGDDLTLLTAGPRAVPFTAAYLRHFRDVTAETLEISELSSGGLGVGAGVAVTKPHHPFWAGYQLAEQLVTSAKQTKARIQRPNGGGPLPMASLDLHVLFESTARHLSELRRRPADRPLVHGGPYVIQEGGAHLAPGVAAWCARHGYERLRSMVDALQVEDDGRLRYPSSQTHRLREGVLLGTAEADRRFARFAARYPKADEAFGVLGQADTLIDTDDDIRSTPFVDAMMLADVERASADPASDSNDAAPQLEGAK